ncbi:MAG: hypothetical protein AAB427_03825 [Chloroflexota bacterium]
MKNTDKFLTGIVIAVVLLVGAAFAVALLRPKPVYQSEDAPEGVAHNYLLALQQGDYERAYGYLAPTVEGYPPSAEAFAENVHDYEWMFRLDEASITLVVESARVTGDRATVTVRETRFSQGGLFESSQSSDTFEMRLGHDVSVWRIIGSDAYWAYCWDDKEGCR